MGSFLFLAKLFLQKWERRGDLIFNQNVNPNLLDAKHICRDNACQLIFKLEKMEVPLIHLGTKVQTWPLQSSGPGRMVSLALAVCACVCFSAVAVSQPLKPRWNMSQRERRSGAAEGVPHGALVLELWLKLCSLGGKEQRYL